MLDEKVFRAIHIKPALREKEEEQVNIPKRLTYKESVEVIYNLIKDDEGIGRAKLMSIVSKSYPYIARRITTLLEGGRIKCKLIACGNSNKTHSYVVV